MLVDPTTYVTAEYRHISSDLVLTLPMKPSRKSARRRRLIVSILIELQMQPDRLMMLQARKATRTEFARWLEQTVTKVQGLTDAERLRRLELLCYIDALVYHGADRASTKRCGVASTRR